MYGFQRFRFITQSKLIIQTNHSVYFNENRRVLIGNRFPRTDLQGRIFKNRFSGTDFRGQIFEHKILGGRYLRADI